jgi:hypothetical protein
LSLQIARLRAQGNGSPIWMFRPQYKDLPFSGGRKTGY